MGTAGVGGVEEGFLLGVVEVELDAEAIENHNYYKKCGQAIQSFSEILSWLFVISIMNK